MKGGLIQACDDWIINLFEELFFFDNQSEPWSHVFILEVWFLGLCSYVFCLLIAFTLEMYLLYIMVKTSIKA